MSLLSYVYHLDMFTTTQHTQYALSSLRKGDEHPAYTLVRSIGYGIV